MDRTRIKHFVVGDVGSFDAYHEFIIGQRREMKMYQVALLLAVM